MNRLEFTVLSKGQDKVDEARKIARNCPVGYLVVHELDTGRVYYRHVHSDNEIETDFTSDHIEIAQGDFPPQDPDYLEWERGNSTLAGPEINVYTAKGK